MFKKNKGNLKKNDYFINEDGYYITQNKKWNTRYY